MYKLPCQFIGEENILLLQKLTTRQPDDSQIEVAIASLKAVLPPEEVNEQ